MSIAAAILQTTPLLASEKEARLKLIQEVSSDRFYADDHFRCQGLPRNIARQKAERALGRDFDARFSRVAEQLASIYGQKVVDDQTEMVAIGYRVTATRCAQVRGIVSDALKSLAKLEMDLGAH